MMISVNNTLKPRTGGEFVYKVMKDELLRQKYEVYDISVPLLLECLIGIKKSGKKFENFYRLILHLQCVLNSLVERCRGHYLILTSSHPAFPVFGHLVYHQPKAGTGYSINRQYLNLYWRIGWMVVENEKLSPIWCLAKRSHVLHLSNSNFTKNLIKKLYGLDSIVLYPPVQITPMLNSGINDKRTFGIVIAKPEVPSGITFLPEIARRLPKTVKFIIIGKADSIGLWIIKILKRKGFNVNYLGYVSEKEKIKLFKTYSHYLHLGLFEPFGITVIEAMASGCIPIAPRSGGIPEYLPQDFLYSSVDEAADKIISRIGMDNIDAKLMLRNIAYNFREESFRKKFMVCIKTLEKHYLE
jgi:glycosyltransferase involved in cell wall biosynthesis